MGLTVKAERLYRSSRRHGFTVIRDEEVAFSSKGDSKLAIPLRRIEILRDEDAKIVAVIPNDMKRSAVEIDQAYKFRWLIELLFRSLKQHLKIRKFLGANPNAVKLEIYAAMIAYIPLRLAGNARQNEIRHSAVRRACRPPPLRSSPARRHRRSLSAQSQQEARPIPPQPVGLPLCVKIPPQGEKGSHAAALAGERLGAVQRE
jgi:hypothetical protein